MTTLNQRLLHFVPNFNSLEVKVFLVTITHRHPQILYAHTKFISKVHSDRFHTSPEVSFRRNKLDWTSTEKVIFCMLIQNSFQKFTLTVFIQVLKFLFAGINWIRTSTEKVIFCMPIQNSFQKFTLTAFIQVLKFLFARINWIRTSTEKVIFCMPIQNSFQKFTLTVFIQVLKFLFTGINWIMTSTERVMPKYFVPSD